MNHNGKIITSIKTKSFTTSEDKIIELIDCQECGFAHQLPLPTLDELGEYYAYHFYSKQKPDYLSKMDEESEYWLTMYNWRIKNILNHLDNTNPNILDVGSSGGFFLEAAKRLGANVFGIEPSSQAANYCKNKFGIDTQVDIYEKATFEANSMDVIHLSLVLEHLLDPSHFIKWAFNILKSDGMLVIEAPYEFNRLQNHLVHNLNYPHWYFSYPDHINYFSSKHLGDFVKKYNLNLVESFSSYPMEMFVLNGTDYLKDSTAGKIAHTQRMNFELNLLKHSGEETYTALSKGWMNSEIGRTQILFFKK